MAEQPQPDTDWAAMAEKQKRKKWINGFLLALILWLCGAMPEVILHISTAQNFQTLWNEGLALGILFSLVPAMVILSLLWILPWKKGKIAVALIYASVSFLLCASQLVYYKVFGCFYSAYSMANGGQVLQFWNIALKKVLENFLWILMMASPLSVLCVACRKWLTAGRIRPGWIAAIPVSAAVLTQLVLILCLPLFGGTGNLTAYDLYHNNADSYYSVNRLGLATAFRLDVTRQITGQRADGNIQLDNEGPAWDALVPTEPDSTATAPSTGATTPSQDSPSTDGPLDEQPVIDTSPNQLDIDWQALIEGETESAVRQVHEYFASRTASNKNEHTGMFEGYNLVMITAEAFSYLAVDEERTPMLYQMMTEGFFFTNYYVPDWGTSTTDGEYAFLTGTIPKANCWSFSNSSDNAMPLTMSRQLIGLGYNAYAYHGHTYTYYNRDQYLTNLGFYYKGYGGDSNGSGNGLNVQKTWPESDLEVVDVSTADFVNDEPFVAYYMSISGHREFNFSGNYIAWKNRDLVAEEPYSTNARAYLACQLELELSLELLVERLEEAGVLDNTLFVITADHYPNGLTVEEMSELAGHEIDTNFEIYKNACIIWTPGMTGEVIDKPCSHLDLLPTLSNLFGLEFDSRLYMGRDIFSDAPTLVMFRNRNWITDYAAYNFTTGEVTALTNSPVSQEYVDAVNTEVSNRFTVSSRILDYDYWSILFPSPSE